VTVDILGGGHELTDIDAPTIFSGLGLSSTSVSLLATGVVGIVMFLATSESSFTPRFQLP